MARSYLPFCPFEPFWVSAKELDVLQLSTRNPSNRNSRSNLEEAEPTQGRCREDLTTRP